MSAAPDSLGPQEPARIEILGVPFHVLSEREVVACVLRRLERGRGGWIVTANLDILRRWIREPEIAATCSQADLVVADGMPLVWAARLQGTPLPERVAGSNLISSLTEAAAVGGHSVFFLGGNPGAGEATACILSARHPRLRVAGTYCPPFGYERDPSEIPRIRAALASARPDIVYVGLGLPKQDRMVHELRRDLPRAWWLGVGISFSFVCGEVRRAPAWMQSAGLEWAHRMVQEPRKLCRRYLVHGLPFAARLFVHCASRRLVPQRG